MKEQVKDIVGYIGGFLLIITMIPQIHRTMKTKKTQDLSIYFLIFQMITCVFFLTYGILLLEYPLMIANTIVLLELVVLFVAKLMYDKRNDHVNRDNKNDLYSVRPKEIIIIGDI